MTEMLFAKRVNAVSDLVSTMTPDPAERLGIVTALCEIYRHDLANNFMRIRKERPAAASEESQESFDHDVAAQ